MFVPLCFDVAAPQYSVLKAPWPFYTLAYARLGHMHSFLRNFWGRLVSIGCDPMHSIDLFWVQFMWRSYCTIKLLISKRDMSLGIVFFCGHTPAWWFRWEVMWFQPLHLPCEMDQESRKTFLGCIHRHMGRWTKNIGALPK